MGPLCTWRSLNYGFRGVSNVFKGTASSQKLTHTSHPYFYTFIEGQDPSVSSRIFQTYFRGNFANVKKKLIQSKSSPFLCHAMLMIDRGGHRKVGERAGGDLSNGRLLHLFQLLHYLHQVYKYENLRI